MNSTNTRTAIYIHWPFCLSKCPYCDFNSHVNNNIDHELFLKGYLNEIEQYRSHLTNKIITSIYLGGGTPTTAKPQMYAIILEKLSEICQFDDNIEITVEANPTSVEMSKIVGLKSAGINRISLGVQSMNDNQLKFLGREHSSTEAITALETVAKYFDNYTFDLIYALPNQTVKDWLESLKFALQFIKYHISLYQLTIEKGTRFYGEYNRGAFTLPDSETSAKMYEETDKLLSNINIQAYEVSNYAKVGYESKHNLNYWNYGEYLGFGPGAHGRIVKGTSRICTMNIHNPNDWLNKVISGQSPIQSQSTLSPQEAEEERVLMGLRTTKGVSNTFAPSKVQDLMTNGLAVLHNNNLSLTLQGRLVLDSIVKFLIV